MKKIKNINEVKIGDLFSFYEHRLSYDMFWIYEVRKIEEYTIKLSMLVRYSKYQFEVFDDNEYIYNKSYYISDRTSATIYRIE